ncbi:MAG: dihydroorotate dehydrogenase, partial [Actinomycetota bacterium]
TVDEYVHVMLRVRDLPGVVAVEANLSSPNLDRGNRVFACHPDQAAQAIGAISRFTATPVFAKLAADVTNIVDVARACVDAGAYGLSLINTLLAMAIDVRTSKPKLGAITGGLSGPAIKPVALRCVYQVAQALPGVPIMGMGGIATAEDAIEFLLAGAWAVQVGTANFYNPDATVEIGDGIRDFLAARGLSSPADLRGRLEVGRDAPEPAYRGG